MSLRVTARPLTEVWIHAKVASDAQCDGLSVSLIWQMDDIQVQANLQAYAGWTAL